MNRKAWLSKRSVMAAIVLLVSIFWLAVETIADASGEKSVTDAVVVSMAVLDFQPSGAKLSDVGSQVAVLLNTNLSSFDNLIVVERQELNKILSEQELGASGTITPKTAARIGSLTGAKIIITGKVFESNSKVFIVAKVMGAETSRVYGESVTIPDIDNLEQGVENLAGKINDRLNEKISTLLAKPEKEEDIVAKLTKMLAGKKLPIVSVNVHEQSFGRQAIDPAVETEITSILHQVGFTIVDPNKSNKKPEITITGEGFSEFATRKGNLYSCKGRVELKATVTETGVLKAVDRQTEVAVDLSERIAGKKALQNAASKLIERMAPKLVRK
jgi:TolB-like protein